MSTPERKSHPERWAFQGRMKNSGPYDVNSLGSLAALLYLKWHSLSSSAVLNPSDTNRPEMVKNIKSAELRDKDMPLFPFSHFTVPSTAILFAFS